MAVGDKIKVGAAGVELSVIDNTKAGFEKAKVNAKKETQALQNQLSNIKIKMDDRLAKIKLENVHLLHKKLKQRLEEKIHLKFDDASIARTRTQLKSVEDALARVKKEAVNKSGTAATNGIGNLFSNVTGISTAQLGIAGVAASVGYVAVEAVKASMEIEGVRNAFNKLNEPNLLNNLREATRGTVNDFELMKVAMRASNFKIPLSKLGTLLEFAQKRAAQTGENVDYLVSSIVDGIGRKSTLVLDNLGISATELQEEVKRVGDFGQATGNIVERELGKMGDVALTTKDKVAQITAAFDNMKIAFGDFVIGATNGFLDFIELMGKYNSISANITAQYEEAANKIIKQNENIIDSWNKAISKARKDASGEASKSTAENLVKLMKETEDKINAVLKGFTIGGIEYSGDLQNELDQLSAKLEVYKNAHKELTTIFDPYKNSIGAVKKRLDLINDMIDKTIKGTKEYNKLIKEQESLEKFLGKGKNNKNLDVEVKIDFDKDKLFEEDVKWLDEIIDQENEIITKRLENETLYSDAKAKLRDEEEEGYKSRMQEEEQIHNLRMSSISEFGNALASLGTHGKTFVNIFNEVLQTAIRIAQAINTINTDKFSGLLGIFSGGLGLVGTLMTLKEGGAVTNYGGGNVSFQPHKKFDSGVNNFVVPPGFNRDNYIVGVQSGERLSVTPANAVSKDDGLNKLAYLLNNLLNATQAQTMTLASKNFNVIINSNVDTFDLIKQKTQPTTNKLNKTGYNLNGI